MPESSGMRKSATRATFPLLDSQRNGNANPKREALGGRY
jgi:hypothetical protein